MSHSFLLTVLGFLLFSNAEAKNIEQGSATEKTVLLSDERRYNIADHGALGDGKTLNTKAIQAVIDECAKNGGGALVIPKGIFISGALFLKPGVNIEFQSGAVLKGSTDINDYPKFNTRIEGHFEPWRTALINGDGVHHLRISGSGTIDGSGEPFWKEFYNRRNADKKTTNLNVERQGWPLFKIQRMYK